MMVKVVLVTCNSHCWSLDVSPFIKKLLCCVATIERADMVSRRQAQKICPQASCCQMLNGQTASIVIWPATSS